MNNAMPGMMGGMGQTDLTPLYATGFNLSDPDQAMTFLSMMLDDSVLQIWGNDYARYFWYGVVTIIGIFAVTNLWWRANLKLRCVPFSAVTRPKQPNIAADEP